jgi:hypothetical protein
MWTVPYCCSIKRKERDIWLLVFFEKCATSDMLLVFDEAGNFAEEAV